MMRACTNCRKLLASTDEVCPDDGAPGNTVELADLPPSLNARFTGLQPFAVGSTGSLFVAPSPSGDGKILVKVIHSSAAGIAAERARLQRELLRQTTLKVLNLGRVLEMSATDGELWVLRQFLAGESLATRIRKQGALSLSEAFAVVAQAATALDELHRAGLLHRDVKPGHVMLSGGPVPLVRLIDAGIVGKLPTASVLEVMGSAGYAAPEVLAGKTASFRSDLYGLGCVLYEALSGTPPLASANPDEPLPPLAREVPPAVQTLLTSLLAPDPRKRPFSAQQVRRVLEPLLPAGMPDSVARISMPPAVPGDAARKPKMTREASVAPPPGTGLAGATANRAADKTEEISLAEIETAQPSGTIQDRDAPTQEISSAEVEEAVRTSLANVEKVRKRVTSSAPPPPPSVALSSRPPRTRTASKTGGTLEHAAAGAPASSRGAAARVGASKAAGTREYGAPPEAPSASSSPPVPLTTGTLPSTRDPAPISDAASDQDAGNRRLVTSVPPPVSQAVREASSRGPASADAPAAAPAPATAAESGAPSSSPKASDRDEGRATSPGAAAVAEQLAAALAAGSASDPRIGPKPASGTDEAPARATSLASTLMGGLGAPAPRADARAKLAEAPPTAASDPEVSRRGGRPGQLGATLMGPGGTGMPGLQLNPTEAPDSVRTTARDTDPDMGLPPAPDLAALSELEPDIGTGAADHPSGAQAVALMSPAAAVNAAHRSHGSSAHDDRSEAAITRKADPLAASEAEAFARAETASASSESSATPGGRRFDVESLFEDKLAPEAPSLVGGAAAREPTEGKVAHDSSNGGYALPRRGITRTWPLLAASAVLGLVAFSLSARACNDDSDRVARSGEPASPPAIVAPAPLANEPEPEPQPAAAEPSSTTAVAANEAAVAEPVPEPAEAKPEPAVAAKPAAAEPASAVAAAPAASETRTLTAARARPAPAGRVIPIQSGPAVAEVDHKANARALYSSGKYREAAEAYQRAAESSPSDAGAFAGLGASWLSANQPERAIAAYQRAVQLKPDVSGFQAALGRAYLQKGDRGRATAAYRKALELDPQNTAAQAGLKNLGVN